MPPKPALREPERGLRFLEDKLSVYVHGPSQTRRNPALDLLTGRVPDTRFQPPAPTVALRRDDRALATTEQEPRSSPPASADRP